MDTIIRIGHLSTFYHTAILLMARGEAEQRLGAAVQWRLFGTGPAIVDAFARGELDLAYLGLPPVIIGIGRGVGIVCIAGGHMEGTVMAGKARWRGFPEIEDLDTVLRQFIGRKIGVPGKGSIHDVILRESLAACGFERDIAIVNYPWADLVTEAIARDEVDAAFGTPALAVAIQRFAGGRVLYPPSRLWPENPSYGIVAERTFLRDRRRDAEGFLLLHEEAEFALRSDPGLAAQSIANHVGIVDREFVLEALRVSPRYCAQLTEGFIASTLRFVPTLRRLGYLGRDVARDEIFDTGLIRAVHPRGDHYAEGIALK